MTIHDGFPLKLCCHPARGGPGPCQVAPSSQTHPPRWNRGCGRERPVQRKKGTRTYRQDRSVRCTRSFMLRYETRDAEDGGFGWPTSQNGWVRQWWSSSSGWNRAPFFPSRNVRIPVSTTDRPSVCPRPWPIAVRWEQICPSQPSKPPGSRCASKTRGIPSPSKRVQLPLRGASALPGGGFQPPRPIDHVDLPPRYDRGDPLMSDTGCGLLIGSIPIPTRVGDGFERDGASDQTRGEPRWGLEVQGMQRV